MRLTFPSVLVAMALVVVACSVTINQDNRACPCASGWACCVGQNVCVTNGAACPSGSGPDGSASGFGEMGKPCGASSDCKSNECVPLKPAVLNPTTTTGAVCSRTCTSVADCVPGWTCDPVPGGPNVCGCQPFQESFDACDGKDSDCNGVVDDPVSANLDCSQRAPRSKPATCVNGGCVCNEGTSCGQGCFDLTSDDANCGACGNACPGATTCAASKCGCGAQTDCGGGVCYDLTSDRANCGACGARCDARAVCAASTCRCMSGDACATDGQHQCAGDGHCHELVDLKLAVPSGVVGRPADLELSTDRVFATFVGDQAILSVPKAGGSTTVAHAAAASTGGKHAVTIATSGADLVYALFATSEIWVCPGGDCTAQTLLASGTADVYLGVLGGNVYWIDYATRTLSTCALAGCGGVPTVVGKVSNIGQGAADASGLWGAFWDGNLRHVSLADGTYSAPLAYVPNVQRLLTDGAFVYWIYDHKLSFCAEGACTQSPLAWLGGGPAVLLGVDAKQVYWLQEPNVFACPSGAPCPVPVAQYDLSAYAGLGGEGVASALDAAHLFVAGSQLLRIAR